VKRNPETKVEEQGDEFKVIDLALARRNKTGRSLKLQPDAPTLELLRRLAWIQCTHNECAAVMGVHQAGLG
jgi:hypothetical protein